MGDFSAVTGSPPRLAFTPMHSMHHARSRRTRPSANSLESPTTEHRVMSERLRRTVVLPVLLAEPTLEPVLVLLAVGHVGPFEGHGLLL